MQIAFHRLLLARRFIPRAVTVRKMPPLATLSQNHLPEQQPMKRAKETEVLRVKKLSEHATLPVRGSTGAAGYDLAR